MNSPSGASPLASISALVVEPDDVDRNFIASRLITAGFRVTAVDSFGLARSCLMARPPAVLVTELELGTDTGLQLARLGRSIRTGMTVAVMSRHRHLALERDADAMGAAFVQKPSTTATLLAALCAAALYEPVPRTARRDISTFLLLEAARRKAQ
jgi:DNA-binding response OmpR family regulator